LVSLEGLNSLKEVTSLSIRGCNALTSFNGLGQLTNVKWLTIQHCTALSSFEGLPSGLECIMYTHNCPNLTTDPPEGIMAYAV
jgi:hypothetical protein